MTGIERLRQMAEDFKSVKTAEYCAFIVNTWRGTNIDDAIADIADQIELETQPRSDHAADVSVSAYGLLPEDERDAIAWVRKHGGLESVKKLLDWVVGHCSTKQQLDFDFWLSGRVMHELGFDEDMADRDEVERRLLARLMPEGMEWPRFEDGEPVKFGDVVSDGDETGRVYYVTFDTVNPVIIGFTDETPDQDPGTWLEVSVNDSERVKRPAPKDSWERLEEDAEKDPCGYFGFDGEETCGKCPASGKNCEQTMALDIVRRAKALAGVGE